MDENVRAAIVAGLRARGIDILTAQDDGRSQTPDPDILDRAMALSRVLYTEDTDFLAEAISRQTTGIPFAGVVYAPQLLPIGVCVVDLHVIATCSEPAEWANRLEYL